MFALILAASLACPAPSQPTVRVPDGPLLPGDAPTVEIVGAAPNSEVSVTASRASSWDPTDLSQSTAVFRADACGTVRLHQAPIRGDWSGSDPRAFLYAMPDDRSAGPATRPPEEVVITADLNGDARADATGILHYAGIPAGAAEVPLGPDHPGAVLIHPAPGERRPAIVLLGGSEGGDLGARVSAPKFVARGYAVVVLPYYQPTWRPGPKIAGLPPAFAAIPLDKLADVSAWLAARDDIGPVGLYGVSKGAEFALSAASRIGGFAAVAAIVPSDVVWEGWGPGTVEGESSSFSWGGEPLPFVPYVGMGRAISATAGGTKRVAMRVPHDEGRAANPDRVSAARIPVEDIAVPVLVAGGLKDTVWASGLMVESIAATRRAAGLPTVALVFPEAGHGLSGTGDMAAGLEDGRAQSVVFAATLRLFAETLGTPERP